MNSPELSIIVPVYNVDEWLQECLDSIMAQTYKNWECIMIDDGSTDWSGMICDNYSKTDNRFRVIHQSNKGVSAARNKGIEESSAPFLSFVDPDDYISQNFYNVLISKMKNEYAQYSVSFSYILTEYNAETYDLFNKYRLQKHNRHSEVFAGNANVIQNIRHLLTYGCWGSVYHRKLWEGERFPINIDLGEDLAIIPKIIAKADKAVYSNETTYFYRVRENSLLRKPISKDRYINCLKAGNQMFSSCKNIDVQSGNTFTSLKTDSVIEMYARYLASSPDITGSKLLHLVSLVEESKIEEEQK